MRKRKIRDGLHRREGSPYWYASYTDANGRRIKRSTGTDDKAEAQALLNKWRADTHQESKWGREPERRLAELMLLYADAHQDKASLDRDFYSLQHLYRLLGEQRCLNSLRTGDVYGYVCHRRNEGASAGTINRETGLLSSALNWARHHLGWRIENTAQRHRLPEPAGRTRTLSREEAQRLLTAAEPVAHLRDFIQMGLMTGMRSGEMLALEWTRVDLARNRIMLMHGDQKNRRADQIPLNQTAREALLNRARFRAEHCPGSTWVFCNAAGERIASVKKSFTSACRRAGIEDCHPHDLRRTCGTWLVNAGVSLHAVSKLLRHSDVRVTDRVYAHLRPGTLADAVAVLDEIREVRDDGRTKARAG